MSKHKASSLIIAVLLVTVSAGAGWCVRDVLAKRDCMDFRLHIRCCFDDLLKSANFAESMERERLHDRIIDLYDKITSWDSRNNDKGEWR